MSVKLIAKRRLAFRNPEDQTFVAVMPGVFETCPDWIKKDPMFRWGVEDGSIQVADPSPVVAKAEPKAEIVAEEPKKAPAKRNKK